MPSRGTLAGPDMEASINGADPVHVTKLTIEREQVDITTEFEPNPTWTYVDPAGHWHARSTATPSYPTLNSQREHQDCDGSCNGTCRGEGFTATRYTCMVCGAPVEPGSRRSVDRKYMDGLEDWQVEVEAPVVTSERVSVVVKDSRGNVYFGFAVSGETRAEGDSDGMRVWTVLHGAGPLGRR